MKAMAIVGCAPYVKAMNLHRLEGIETIGCNRILLHPYFRPTHLMVADRRVYLAERARYRRCSESVDMMLGGVLFDRDAKGHGVKAVRRPKFRHWVWRAGNSQGPLSWRTWAEPLNSFINIAGPMLQAAVLMGATYIAMIGCGLVLDPGRKHFYQAKDNWSLGHTSRSQTWGCFIKAKYELDDMGIKVFNISLENGPFERMWGKTTMGEFLQEAKQCQ